MPFIAFNNGDCVINIDRISWIGRDYATINEQFVWKVFMDNGDAITLDKEQFNRLMRNIEKSPIK